MNDKIRKLLDALPPESREALLALIARMLRGERCTYHIVMAPTNMGMQVPTWWNAEWMR
jgi:hypothetical protein